MIYFLKKIKYFLINHKTSGSIYLFVNLILNGKIIKNFFFKSNFQNIGKFKSKVNISNFEELKLLKHDYYDHPNIQSFRNFDLKNSKFFFLSNELILKNFLTKTIKIRLFYPSKINKSNFFFNYDKNCQNIIICDNSDIFNKFNFVNLKDADLIFIRKDKNFILKDFTKYKYVQGRILNLNNKVPNYYSLFSKKKININKTIKKRISGFSTLKSLDIYPFDLAYESVLPYVDEFVLGIDTSTFSKKYKIILDKFLSKTKYRKKIKLKFFDFNSQTTLGMRVRGRWITDANNKMINECTGEYCFYIQADEIFQNIKKNSFKKLFINNPSEIYFKFLHYVYNLETIIDPKKSSYTRAIRIFKKDLYAASHDGFSFHNLTPFRPTLLNSKYLIRHISYVFNYKKKIKEHFEKKDGLHINQLSKKQFINDYIIPKKVHNIKNELNHLKYLSSYKNLQ